MAADMPNVMGESGSTVDQGAESGVCDGHLRVEGLTKQFALMVDASFLLEGIRVPVHKSIVTASSLVLADLFFIAANSSQGDPCLPLPGHTVQDICTALKYIYTRSVAQLAHWPSKHVCISSATARPIVTFAHKFAMKNILDECDVCLSEQAQEGGGSVMFKTQESVIEWATLAEECSLHYLLATAELFMTG